MELAHYAIMVAFLLILVLGVVNWRLFHVLQTLNREFQQLSREVAIQGNDMTGMASAAVHVDRVLCDQDQRLRECLERLESVRTEDSLGAPYHLPIERIRNGATAEDLVAEFGLSLSEANLLIRLHGPGK